MGIYGHLYMIPQDRDQKVKELPVHPWFVFWMCHGTGCIVGYNWGAKILYRVYGGIIVLVISMCLMGCIVGSNGDIWLSIHNTTGSWSKSERFPITSVSDSSVRALMSDITNDSEVTKKSIIFSGARLSVGLYLCKTSGGDTSVSMSLIFTLKSPVKITGNDSFSESFKNVF